MHQKVKLTDKIVEKLPIPDRGNRLFFDSECTGFACRVTAAGNRSYIYNYRSVGKQRRFTIGSVEKWTASSARKEATRLKGDVARGIDPLAELEEDRNAKTVADMCQRFTEDHLPRLRPSSQRDYTKLIEGKILPALGKKKVADVTFSDIDGLHRKITRAGAPYQANRCMAVLSRMFSLSIRWGWRTDNPAKGIERNQEQKRHRYLSGEELARLTEALADFEDRQAADIVRVLLLTGCRKGEALAMRWSQLDLTAGTWTKEASETKAKRFHSIPISGAARQLLSELRAKADADAEFVFPGRFGGHREDIKIQWPKILRSAGIDNLRIHDLRHSHAAILASSGLSLPVIGALLGHSQPSTTQRYAHLMDDPLREATERVAGVVTGAGRPSAEILPMKKGGS